MRLLTVVFVSTDEFLSHYRECEPAGAIYCRTRAIVSKGETVLLEVYFPGLPNRALIRGNAQQTSQGSGAWIAFHESELSTRDFLLQVARGHLEIKPRRGRSFDRFPASLPVDCRISGDGSGSPERLVSRTEDISAGGVFVRSVKPPPVGARVAITLGGRAARSIDPLSLTGEVAWVRTDESSRGFGVRFHDKTQIDHKTLRTLLRRASETGKVAFAQASGT